LHNKRTIDIIRSGLLLKIVFQSAQTLQLFTVSKIRGDFTIFTKWQAKRLGLPVYLVFEPDESRECNSKVNILK